METTIQTVTRYIATFVEVAAALVIAVASVQALFIYAKNVLGKRSGEFTTAIRLKLGRALSLALEFLLGADILQTAIAPTWNEIGQLAAIAILRTALNYFLERELKEGDK